MNLIMGVEIIIMVEGIVIMEVGRTIMGVVDRINTKAMVIMKKRKRKLVILVILLKMLVILQAVLVVLYQGLSLISGGTNHYQNNIKDHQILIRIR
jgi:hypothetical protein